VLSSAAASTQTTILPTGAHEPVDGALGGAAEVVRQRQPALPDPTVSTIAMGVVSVIWYIAVNELSQNVLGDSSPPSAS